MHSRNGRPTPLPAAPAPWPPPPSFPLVPHPAALFAPPYEWPAAPAPKPVEQRGRTRHPRWNAPTEVFRVAGWLTAAGEHRGRGARRGRPA